MTGKESVRGHFLDSASEIRGNSISTPTPTVLEKKDCSDEMPQREAKPRAYNRQQRKHRHHRHRTHREQRRPPSQHLSSKSKLIKRRHHATISKLVKRNRPKKDIRRHGRHKLSRGKRQVHHDRRCRSPKHQIGRAIKYVMAAFRG